VLFLCFQALPFGNFGCSTATSPGVTCHYSAGAPAPFGFWRSISALTTPRSVTSPHPQRLKTEHCDTETKPTPLPFQNCPDAQNGNDKHRYPLPEQGIPRLTIC
jgi:hypothetical protein